jgi:two-component system NtrC family sensor kinase
MGLSRRRLLTLGVIAMSVGMTAAMSIVFHRAVRPDMLVTGLVCAIVIDRVVNRITGHYRRRLAIAHETLERRVAERTRELELVNQSLRDVAEQRTSLREELMIRDRMATAGMLAAGVSHEIRSPLSVIMIVTEEITELLAGRVEPEVRQMLADVSDASSRIALILRDLSSIARPVDDPIAPIELQGVIDSAARLASYKLEKGVRLERGRLDVPPVLGNAPRLVQLILNLVVNAARASRLDVENTIRIEAVTTSDDVIVTVSDTGTGMSAETRARLFEPFFTTGGDRGGTGLGLTICRSIVERMGGSIELRSTLGEGTAVEVRLRRAESQLALAS